MNGLLIKRAPPLAVIQDLGRIGYQHWGVTRGGPLDPVSHRWANRLLGNRPEAAVLEISLGGIGLEAMIDTAICVTGTAAELTINGQAAALWRGHRIKAGDVVTLGSDGARRNYLAVAGGIRSASVLGSRSTVVRDGLGGLGGGSQARALRGGDLLPCEPRQAGPVHVLSGQDQPELACGGRARVVPVRGALNASRQDRRALYRSRFRVGPRSNRMGFQLVGPKLPAATRGSGRPAASSGICVGSIQLPPDGQPFVLLADHQTMGGYPVIGVVAAVDLAVIGRCIPGDALCFVPITPGTAHAAWQSSQQAFASASERLDRA